MRRLASLLLILSLVSCMNPFAPPMDKSGSGGLNYLEQTSPENVIANFRLAYTQKNLAHFRDCLDEDFRFRYFDDRTNRYESYGLYDEGGEPGELTRTRLLFDAYEEIIIEDSSWVITDSFAEPSDGDTLEVRYVNFLIMVFDYDGVYSNAEARGYAIFKFKEEEGIYRIVLWEDNSIR
ncbi:hypothetical protein J7K18_07945 [bacterium]|nr:hypothetical protein [bacterium]